MPKKRAGYTQISLLVPDDLIAVVDAKRGETPRNTHICAVLAADAGVPYTPPVMGPKSKPGPKPKKPAPKKKK